MVLFALGVVVHVLKGPHPIMVVYTARDADRPAGDAHVFRARRDPGSLLTVFRFVPLYLAIAFGFGVVTLLLEQDHVTEQLTAGGILRDVAAGLIGLDGPYDVHRRFFSDFFPAALLALGIAGLLAFSVLLFRAVARRDAPTPRTTASTRARLVRAVRLGHARLLRAAAPTRATSSRATARRWSPTPT